MHIPYLWAILATSLASALPSLSTRQGSGLALIDDVTVFQSGPNNRFQGVLYARSLQLPDGSLISTAEDYTPEPPLVRFPVYKSIDYGRSWSLLSTIEDQTRGFGARYQPHFFLLPEAVGDFPAGTIVFCGNFIPADLSETHLDIYASRDGGASWNFVSSIAPGGRALPDNGLTPVWEPFFVHHEGVLTVYFADQRDPAHGQKCVHRTTTDLLTWGNVVNDVANPNYGDRPGMPVVAQLANGQWMLVYEFVGAPEGNAPGYYKIANDPYSFGASPPIASIAPGNRRPQSSPSIVVTDTGRIIVSGCQTRELFINDQNGAPNAWRTFDTPQPSGYSRYLEIVKEPSSPREWLLVSGGGWFGDRPINRLSVGVFDLSRL